MRHFRQQTATESIATQTVFSCLPRNDGWMAGRVLCTEKTLSRFHSSSGGIMRLQREGVPALALPANKPPPQNDFRSVPIHTVPGPAGCRAQENWTRWVGRVRLSWGNAYSGRRR